MWEMRREGTVRIQHDESHLGCDQSDGKGKGGERRRKGEKSRAIVNREKWSGHFETCGEERMGRNDKIVLRCGARIGMSPPNTVRNACKS